MENYGKKLIGYVRKIRTVTNGCCQQRC